jgi:uncharacterized protein (TIGR02646 family)
MIKVTRVPCPVSLDGPASPGGRETAVVAAYYARSRPAGKPPKFTAYTRDDVRAALTEMFGTKCAYCEFEYAGGAPPDAEHYRPKNEVETLEKTELPRGYYWLAATWSNLLPTCIDCNRPRTQTIDGETLVAGKGIRFPLADESKRARRPGDEVDEEPLLLDPTVDDPTAHLRFGDEGIVRAADGGAGASRRGAETIKVLGLNRQDLVTARRAAQLWVDTAINRLIDAARQLELDPQSEYARRQRDGAYEELRKRASSDHPFAAMARQRLRDLI